MTTKSFFNEVNANDLPFYVFGNLVECSLPQKCVTYSRLRNQLNNLESPHLFIDVTKDGMVLVYDDIDVFHRHHNYLDSIATLQSEAVCTDGYHKLEICLTKY